MQDQTPIKSKLELQMIQKKLNTRYANKDMQNNLAPNSAQFGSRFLDILQKTSPKKLRILGIESSCDDTAAAIVNCQGDILSEVIYSQNALHATYGGIVPSIAAESHTVNMPFVIKEALDKAGLKVSDLDAVAVTRGPGLPGSLGVCLNAAKTLAAVYEKPLIGVHHMEAHALVARMGNTDKLQFPFLCLLISGGHTMLVVANDVNDYKILGSTLDDSIGEAFDKVSRHLSIPDKTSSISFGEALEKYAKKGDPNRFKLPIPLNKSDSSSSTNFSFSGLKSAVFRIIDSDQFTTCEFTNQADMAASFQYTATKHLLNKINNSYKKLATDGIFLKSFVVSGGVARNMYIRSNIEKFCLSNNLVPHFPAPKLCTDNGVMIAWAGIERFKKNLIDPYSITFIQRWPLDSLGK
ncbi:hypothetical protein BB561_002251 [Smittium simulii]|uniref:N(6)-L-threonylcarbamoyladenine synthase n=1 Tax=Smittium simulii TaxID=133385 RepID=A0A2T9YR36_9FUNG|nr:hypothetical protein BB561_002251 [Smittium simulii]